MALFTHSYYYGNAPELNPLADYVDAFAVCVAYPTAGSSQDPTPEYLGLKAKGFVFCKWLDINGSIMLLAKPSEAVGKCAAMVCNSLYGVADQLRFVVSYYHAGDGSMTYNRIAGDVLRSEFEAAQFEFVGNVDAWISTHQRRMARASDRYKPAYETTLQKLAAIKAGEFKLTF